MASLTVTPAYGRDYKSSKEALADWENNKDFVEALSGKYVNKIQVPKREVWVRYFKLMRKVKAQ